VLLNNRSECYTYRRVPVADIVAARHRYDGQTCVWRIRNQRKLGVDSSALCGRTVEKRSVRGGREKRPLHGRE